MIIKEILMGLFPRGKSSKDGIWDYLGKRAQVKGRIELEQERNKGTQQAIQALMPGMELHEGGPGWVRVIRAPGAASPSVLFTATVSAPPIAPIAPIAPGELDPALPQAQGQADES